MWAMSWDGGRRSRRRISRGTFWRKQRLLLVLSKAGYALDRARK